MTRAGSTHRRTTCVRFALMAVMGLLLLAPRGSAADPDLGQIRAAREARQLVLADSLARDLLAHLASLASRDTALLARVHRERAEIAWTGRTPRRDAAIASVRIAAELHDRLPGQASTAARMRLIGAALRIGWGQPDSALLMLAGLEPRAIHDDSLRGECAFLRGRAQAMLRQWSPAMHGMRAGASMLDRTRPGNLQRVGEMLTDLGVAATAAADYDSALAALHEARQILEGDPIAHARTLGPLYRSLSILARNLGDLSESVDFAQRALELTRRAEGDSTLAVGRLHALLGLRLALVSDWRAAEREFARAVALLSRNLGPDHFLAVNNTIYRAEARSMIGDTTGALLLLEEARRLAMADSIRHDSNLLFIRHVHAGIRAGRAQPDAARTDLELALERASHTQDERGTIRAELVRGLFELSEVTGQAVKVRELGMAFERIADSTGLRRNNVFSSVQLARARAEARVGLVEDAWAHAFTTDSLALIKALSDARGMPESRALELAHQLSSSLDVLLWLAADAPSGRLATAWDRLVGWRGAVQDEIARLRTPTDDDPALRDAHRSWAAAQRRLARLIVAPGAAEHGAAWRERADAARVTAEEEERRYVRLAGERASAPETAASLQGVLGTLASDEAIVSFADVSIGRGRERLLALLATGEDRTPRCIDLGPTAELRALVDAWRDQLEASPAQSAQGRTRAERACRAAGMAVRERLWDPVVAALGPTTHIDVVEDGLVLDLPWGALPTDAGRFLVESGPALRVLSSERERLRTAATRSDGQLLALGDPEFGERGARASRTGELLALRDGSSDCTPVTRARLESLPSARLEVADLALAWTQRGGHAVALVGAQASEMAFRREAPRSTILHLATHGVVLEDTCRTPSVGMRGVGGVSRVEASATARRHPGVLAKPTRPEPAELPWLGRRVLLALTGEAGAEDRGVADSDGWLTAEEVSLLDLRAVDWVVLSACHAGMASQWPHQGSLGMRRAFQLSGARTVIASLWAVEDAATREWMRELYDARAAGVTEAAAAIRRAHSRVLAARRDAKRSTHPFYWAAFVATGR